MKTTMSEWDTAWDEYQKSLKNITPAVNPINHRSTPTVLYNGMLAPFVPYAMKGVIWYQGEANAAKPDNYADHFMTLIRDWRWQWGIGDFPFLYVQLASIGGESYSGLREAQRQALALPNTAMVVCIDTDSGLHPLNKKPVADRLAMAARALAYGEKIEYSGPLPVVATATDSIASITFSHIGAGLASVDGGELKSFEIAGADGIYLPATARIDGDKIMVSSVKILNPVAVRYGWRDGLIRNLVNKNGFPASPFCINIKKGG
jgi:sialate O-acetylesterase